MLEISTDKNRLDVDMIQGFLSQTHWAKNRSRKIIEKSLKGSICFGVYFHSKQVGFARVVTDEVIFAYLLDVFILKEFQGRGWSRVLLEKIFSEPRLKSVSWMLKSRDAGALYEKFGFVKIDSADHLYIKSAHPQEPR